VDPGAAGVYADLITEQLLEERARKTSLEQRAGFAITSSGALVTLLFALASVAVNGDRLILPSSADGWLSGALVCFALAAIAGVITNLPRNYGEPTPQSLQEMLEDPELPKETVGAAIVVTADARLQTLRTYREQNGVKARLLTCALGLEAAGVVAVSIVVIMIVG
jgi:hypothetical protein